MDKKKRKESLLKEDRIFWFQTFIKYSLISATKTNTKNIITWIKSFMESFEISRTLNPFLTFLFGHSLLVGLFSSISLILERVESIHWYYIYIYIKIMKNKIFKRMILFIVGLFINVKTFSFFYIKPLSRYLNT